MDQLQVQVARARRRLVLDQFLHRSVWCLLAALSLAAIVIAAPRIFVIQNLPTQWDMWWIAGAIAGSVLTAAAWTYLALTTALDAAIEIDRRFELRERVASSLSLTVEDRTSDAGRALVGDAARAINRIEVGEQFRVRLGRHAWLPLVPASLLFVAVTFFDVRAAQSSGDSNSPAARQNIKANMQSLREKIAEQRKQAKQGELPVAEDMFKQIEEGTKDLTQDKLGPDRSKAMVKLNDLAKQLEEKKQQLGGQDQLQKQFENMKNFGAGPADKAAQAIKQGDWQQAQREIEKLEKQLADGKLDEASKKQLANQLERMQQKLEAAADMHRQAIESLKQQIEQQKRDGNLAKAGELQQKLDKLMQQQQQMNQLQKLAQQMAVAQQALKQGDAQKAADAMQQIAQQMQQMQQDQKEMQALDAMMNQLQMAKDALAGLDNQPGEPGADGQGNQQGQMNMNNLNILSEVKDNPPGMGMGPGRGFGPRPIAEDNTNLRDTRVRQNIGRGGAYFGGMREGPNTKGDVAEQVKEAMAAVGSEQADPLTDVRLPASRREQAEEYFRTLREGK